LLYVDRNNNDYDLRVDQYDSFPGYNFASSYVPRFPWGEVSVSELGLSPAHTSTATHRFFETNAAPRSAQRQQARQPLRSRPGRGRRSRRRKASSISYYEDEDIWITVLSDETEELDMPSIEDVWLTVLDDDEDDFEPPQTYFAPQLPVQKLYGQEVTIAEIVFDDIFADHLSGWKMWPKMRSSIHMMSVTTSCR
jgi:hypothetical protein